MSRLAARTRWVVFTLGLVSVSAARGDDLVTLSGTTYHDVSAVRVEPDGVTWSYAEGMCKVDFTDSPKSVCTAYHYDPAKAVAYRAAQTVARREYEVQTRKVLQEDEQRRIARLQGAAMGKMSATSIGRDVMLQRAASPAASEATRALGEQVAARAAVQAAAPTGVWSALANSKTGAVLSALGVSFGAAGPPPDKDEYQTSLHHPKGTAPAADTAHDSFYTPDYSTRTYYEDVDRSEAFARGVPLKP